MLKTIAPAALAEAVAAATPGLDQSLCQALAARLVQETDERLEENVRQWMSGAPLTDVWIGKYCIGMVMALQSCGFLEALEAMNAYCTDPELGERKIWRAVR